MIYFEARFPVNASKREQVILHFNERIYLPKSSGSSPGLATQSADIKAPSVDSATRLKPNPGELIPQKYVHVVESI